MDDQHLPDELAQIEADLAARARREPPAELRERTLMLVRAELRADARRSWWSFGALAAAAALLCVNLSLSAISPTINGHQLVDARQSVAARARLIRELLPEVSEREARRPSLVYQPSRQPVWSADASTNATLNDRQRALNDLLLEGE